MRVIVWENLEGYRLTGDTLALVHSGWYLPDQQFDREGISDEEALLDGFCEFLPRLDEHGRIELSPRRRQQRLWPKVCSNNNIEMTVSYCSTRLYEESTAA